MSATIQTGVNACTYQLRSTFKYTDRVFLTEKSGDWTMHDITCLQNVCVQIGKQKMQINTI